MDARVLELPSHENISHFIYDLRWSHKPNRERTVFRSAFRAVTSILEEELSGAMEGVDREAIDLQVLLFTDGCDTSMGIRNCCSPFSQKATNEASTASARSHFDAMKARVEQLGIQSFFVYVAAYSSDHDPAQCQYMSDKFVYVSQFLTCHLIPVY